MLCLNELFIHDKRPRIFRDLINAMRCVAVVMKANFRQLLQNMTALYTLILRKITHVLLNIMEMRSLTHS
jgi:hypothetical protein